jgi:hypothetical protein
MTNTTTNSSEKKAASSDHKMKLSNIMNQASGSKYNLLSPGEDLL